MQWPTGLLAWCHLILFLRAGVKEENRTAAIRHARAAVTHGRDDATALATGAFAIGLVEHDHVSANEAFEQALALSPSSALTLFLGGVASAYAGEAERAMRARVEHVFGHQENSMGRKIVRTIGMARARFKIGMMNLGYNMRRLVQLERVAAAPA